MPGAATIIPSLIAGTATTAQIITTFAAAGLELFVASRRNRRRPTRPSPREVTSRDTVSPMNVIYGEARVYGTTVFFGTSGTTNEFLWMVVALSGHEVEDITEYWIDEENVTEAQIGQIDRDVDSGKFANVMRIKRHLGTDGEGVDADLFNAFPEWTTDFRGRGRAYIAVMMTFDVATYDTTPSNFSALVRGKKVFDSRKFAVTQDQLFRMIAGGDAAWFANKTQSSAAALVGWQRAIEPTAPAGENVATVTDNSDNSIPIYSDRYPLDATKDYTVTIRGRQTSGDRTHTLSVQFYDNDGNEITGTGSGATGWLALASDFIFALQNAAFTGNFATYSTSFGPTGTASVPAGAVEFSIGGLFCGTGTTSTTIEIQDYRAFEGLPLVEHDPIDPETWEWSDNPALCTRDFVCGRRVASQPESSLGLGEDHLRIREDVVSSSANVCDELVTVPTTLVASGQEKRFTINGTFQVAQSRAEQNDNFQSILETFMGSHVYSRGMHYIRPGSFRAPEVAFDDSSIIEVNVQLQRAFGDGWNAVKGTYYTKDDTKGRRLVSFPPRVNSTYVSNDGGERFSTDLALELVDSLTQALRIAIHTLRLSRHGAYVRMLMMPDAAELKADDNFYLTYSGRSWVNKVFRVESVRLLGETGLVFVTAREDFPATWLEPNNTEYVATEIAA